jgi:hypothetical protein
MRKAFLSLIYIKLVDICFIDDKESCVIPPPLFCTVIRIRIDGKMYAHFSERYRPAYLGQSHWKLITCKASDRSPMV